MPQETGFGRKKWTWVVIVLEWRGSTCICSAERRSAVSARKIEGYQALLMASLPQMATQNLWESGGEQLLSCTFFLTRNYYMEWHSLPTDSDCLHLLIKPCFPLIGDSLTVFQFTLFSCLTGFTLAYTNISLSENRKQHIKMRSCCLQKMSDALIHIFMTTKLQRVPESLVEVEKIKHKKKPLTPCVSVPSMPTAPVVSKFCSADNTVLCSPHPMATISCLSVLGCKSLISAVAGPGNHSVWVFLIYPPNLLWWCKMFSSLLPQVQNGCKGWQDFATHTPRPHSFSDTFPWSMRWSVLQQRDLPWLR